MSNTIKNEIKGYISSSGWTITDIVEKMNENLPTEKKTTVQNISNKLTRGTIKYSEVKEIAEIIGMKIEWNKKEDAQ
ncbi:phosphoribosylglycinamide formyltransferase [Lysinibacillus sphaericus]|uniref:LLM class flavin-dependent oxidoreductase n=1 Tax=Lysinibacillus sphaericus TaxID=1421 RepID=UPI0010645A6D|nr:LLM class flavin-dependent oxidoreductase [Lysinibacillus sphaericus]MBG9452542.1 phosphoribosylglycinamide formyltransferase [Lysinibacillus sphaericus]MBG9477295.1 phosphoribosylglycinamide formyltransferase [Lysinibacillus sphaericus]MBG9592801.1 phosphoribosylglycinamide formyltransferase [Lysinibacillus sphaericus]